MNEQKFLGGKVDKKEEKEKEGVTVSIKFQEQTIEVINLIVINKHNKQKGKEK